VSGPGAEPAGRRGAALGPADEQAAAEELELWRRAEQSGDAELRGQLVERYLPLCRAIAASLFARRVADDAEFADYMQYATLGLIEAVDSYDWRRGVRFNTFATYRIQGAIRNSMVSFSERREQLGLAYRLKRERIDSIKQAEEATPARPARRGAVVREMADVAVIWALSYLLEGSGMLAPRGDAHYTEQFYDGLEMRQIKQRLVGLVDALPDQERRVIKYHYFQNLEFTEIARIFGVSKGRISQIHKRALLLLREAHAIAGGIDLRL
jgi:RNA polymerase sigma factor for flagellar operon FliA